MMIRIRTMRTLAVGFMLFAVACEHGPGHASGPMSPVDGGIYGLTGTSEGPPPVLINRVTDPADGSTRTDYLIGDRITFVYGSGRALRELTSSEVLARPGFPTESSSGTNEFSGVWSPVGDKAVVRWEIAMPGFPTTFVDTMELVDGQLRGHVPRLVCAQCTPGTRLDLIYVRGAGR
jgi:hypothetical protein